MKKLASKLKSNLHIYQNDIATKGLYWSIIHRLYKLPSMRKVLTPLVNTLKPNHVMSRGHKIFIDKHDGTISQELILSGKWEDFETEVFSKFIRPGDVVIDIGAHIGWYTLIAAKLVGKKGKVYAFEPDTTNFKLLTKNIQANGYQNVILVKKAVSNETGSARLFINNENTGDHRIFDTDNHRKSITIEQTTLDDYFKKLPQRVDLIKMDIQGSEMKALLGAQTVLKKNKQLKLITELQPGYILQSGQKPKDYLAFIRRHGFNIYIIDEIVKKLELVKSDKKLLDTYPDTEISETNFTNLFCTRAVINKLP